MQPFFLPLLGYSFCFLTVQADSPVGQASSFLFVVQFIARYYANLDSIILNHPRLSVIQTIICENLVIREIQ